jgi:hypothetical protein
MAQSPFPGMDPYLESPKLWADVHHRLINIFAEQLSSLLIPKYFAQLESYIVIDQISDDSIIAVPDVAITEDDFDEPTDNIDTIAIAPAPLRLKVPMPVPTHITNIHIKQNEENEELVTVIELLSPVKSLSGKGREKYLKKRNALFESRVHLIELDLLRRYSRMPFVEETLPDTDYLAMVSRAYERPNCDVWTISLREPLPVLPVPLLRPEPDVPLDLGRAMRTAYERAHYERRINYNAPPIPPLEQEDAAWAKHLDYPK